MGRRSRKRRDPARPPRPPGAARPEAEPRDATRRSPSAAPSGYARGEERNEAVRRSLEPLAPGERPPVVTVAAVVAFVLCLANVGLWAAGVEVSGREPSVGAIVLQAGILLVAAIGMWKARYWAVLGFQALLGLSILLASVSLLVASNVAEAVFCLAIIVLGGWLFWKLIRALARLQMPDRRPRPGDV